MKAMVLAAGLGKRLRPLTNNRPKALVEINGRTLLEITLARLCSFGVSEVIVNAHHCADVLMSYLREHKNFGMRIEISREDVLLETGGGLKNAAHFFLHDGSDEPFILHNVDVLSTIDIGEMLRIHREQNAIATLATQDRKTSRYLLFNESGHLCGRKIVNGDEPLTELVRDCISPQALAFSGIHVISPRLLTLIREEGVFSIIETYLRLAAAGEKVLAFRADEYYWRDLGTAESIARASTDIASGLVKLP